MFLKLIDSDSSAEMTFTFYDDKAFLEALSSILRSLESFDIEFFFIDNQTACIVF